MEIRALDWLSSHCESLEKAFTKQSTSFLAGGVDGAYWQSGVTGWVTEAENGGEFRGHALRHGFLISSTSPVHLLPPPVLDCVGWVGGRSLWS